jgi:hypothetical protein
LSDITQAITNYYSIDDYLESIYEKDITTKYNPRQKDKRRLKFILEDADAQAQADAPVAVEPGTVEPGTVEPPAPAAAEAAAPLLDKPKIVKIKKIKPKLVLQQDKPDLQEDKPDLPGIQDAQESSVPAAEIFRLEDIVNPNPNINAADVKEEKTRKQRAKKLQVTPHGKTKKKLNIIDTKE